MQDNYASYASKLYILCLLSIYLTLTIYISNTCHLYMERLRSIYPMQTNSLWLPNRVCFIFQHCPYLCIPLSVCRIHFFTCVFPFRPAEGRIYGILLMHKIQNVSIDLAISKRFYRSHLHYFLLSGALNHSFFL